jgi:anti-anti-sigma factor
MMTLNTDKATGTLKISGTLDIDGANALREALLDCLQREGAGADLREVDGCDAAALQVLLACRKDAAQAGKTFRFTADSIAVTQMATALGLSFSTLDSGVEASGGGSEEEHPNAG